MNIDDSNKQPDINETRYLVAKFQIDGILRFLSHSQTLSMFQRAVIRADINPQYSQGFNPRPRISLPLPRPLGIESDDEVMVMPISIDSESIYEFSGYTDEKQNQAVMERVANIATECGLDSGEVKNIFRILIKMSIERQHELSGEGNLP